MMELILNIKNYRIFFNFILYYILSLFLVQNSSAQDISNNLFDSNKFDVLRSQIDLFTSYVKLSKTQLNLLSEADSLGSTGEFEIGLIYLEEILEGLNSTNDSGGLDNIESIQKQSYKNIEYTNDLSMSFITGIDFDRHEFEYGYETSDSTILEELNKPYAGFSFDYILYNSENNKLNFYNSLRYDSENLRNNYQLNFLHKNLNLKYGGYINNSNSSDYSSYWENNFQVNFNENLSEKMSLVLRNVYNYKTYEKSELNYSDYYRNYFETNLNYQLFNYDLNVKYSNEINEYLGNENYDYRQNKFGIGYKKLNNLYFQHSILLDYELRNYEILYGDSTTSNTYKQLSFLIDLNMVL